MRMSRSFDQIASGDSAFQESLNKLGAAVEQVNANVNTVNNTAARTQLDSATNTATPSVGSAMVPASDPDRHDFGSMGLRGTAMFLTKNPQPKPGVFAHITHP